MKVSHVSCFFFFFFFEQARKKKLLEDPVEYVINIYEALCISLINIHMHFFTQEN